MKERSARAWAWPLLLAALALLHAWSFHGTGPADDDYILYRYAGNLVAGRGLVFDAGERVEGFTAPLYVLVLALGMLAGIAPLALSLAIGYASAAAASFAVAREELVAERRIPVAACFVAASPAIAFHANVGMGTTLLAAWFAGAYALQRRAERAAHAPCGAAICFGLAALLRAEAVLFALPFAWLELRRRRLVTGALALAPVASWTLFRLAYFGRFLPVTYSVKKLPFAVDLGYGARYLVENTWSSGVLLLLALAGLYAWRERARLAPAERVALIGLALHALYVVYVGGDYMRLGRFLVPTLPLAFLFGVRGALALAPALRRPAIGGAAALLCLLALQGPQLERGALRAVYEQNERRWIAIGEELLRSAPPRSSIALAPIGAIGWHSKLRVIDRIGLTNEAILRAEPDLSDAQKGHHRHDPAWVLAQEPDYVLIGNGQFLPGTQTIPAFTGDRLLLARPEFRALYEPMAMPIGGSYPLVLYVRRGSTPPAGAHPVARR